MCIHIVLLTKLSNVMTKNYNGKCSNVLIYTIEHNVIRCSIVYHDIIYHDIIYCDFVHY